jgi:aminobenzoyl-glutamate transport protein
MSGEVLSPVNLLSAQGLRSIIGDMVKNISGFSPLGTVIVSLLGFSFAEKSGLIPTLVKGVVLKSSKNLLIPMIFTASIMSHMAGEVGHLLIPLGAMAFHQRRVGHHRR